MGFISIPFLLLLELFSSLRAFRPFCLLLLSPASEQLAYRVSKKYFCSASAGSRLAKRKNLTKWKKKRGKNAPTANIGMLPASPRCKISAALVILILASISSSLILNLIVGSLIFHFKVCRRRSHDYHESPKSDFFVYYPRLRFISLVLLFYAWHLCLAVITHRVLPFFFSLPSHLGTLFPFATLYAVPDVNLFFFFFSILISNLQLFIHFFFFFFFSFDSFDLVLSFSDQTFFSNQ